MAKMSMGYKPKSGNMMPESEGEMKEEYMNTMSDSQDIVDTEAELIAPVGKYGVSALNGLVNAYNEAMRTMGVPDTYPLFEADQTKLPAEFVKGLVMLVDSADKAGIPDALDMADLKDDRGLMYLTGQVRSLAKNPKFAEAMQSPETMGDEMVEDMGESMPAAPKGKSKAKATNKSEDSFFTSRMK